MKNNRHILKLFANCVPVKGIKRSIIYDLQRRTYKFIPNAMYVILSEHKNRTIDEIKFAFDNKYDEFIDEYVVFLINNEFCFFCDEPDNFLDIHFDWQSPLFITNAIMDFYENSNYNYLKFINEIESLSCESLDIRDYSGNNLCKIEDILTNTKYSCLKSINVYIKYSPSVDDNKYYKLCKTNYRIKYLYVHASPYNKEVSDNEFYYNKVIYTVNKILNHDDCGIIDSAYFSTNIKMFTEAQHFNTCLNRKISIDVDGNIKNCPSMERSFGNINDSSLKDVLEIPSFKNLWKIKKDEIEVCKDCEFRYMCADCRVFIKDKNNLYSKPSKCNYDP